MTPAVSDYVCSRPYKPNYANRDWLPNTGSIILLLCLALLLPYQWPAATVPPNTHCDSEETHCPPTTSGRSSQLTPNLFLSISRSFAKSLPLPNFQRIH